jgi:hypothetical protein
VNEAGRVLRPRGRNRRSLPPIPSGCRPKRNRQLPSRYRDGNFVNMMHNVNSMDTGYLLYQKCMTLLELMTKFPEREGLLERILTGLVVSDKMVKDYETEY